MSIARARPRAKRNGRIHTLPGAATRPLWHSPSRNGDKPVLITGGAGFIGTNLADRLLSARQPVIVYDNFSRPGVRQNFDWLRSAHGDLVRLEEADVRDFNSLRRAVARASQVFHFAAQVAVTTSLADPITDFEINVRGTLNLLEALRALDNPPPLIFTSTNKVYGDLCDIRLRMNDGRYQPENNEARQHGFSEERSLHFHSPYGCSKGAACQYVLDYARTFGLRTAVFRMSCIYGLHQFGNEDQGWIAHFLIRALDNQPITIYGDGRQVRDVLFADDLIDAFLLAQRHIDALAGQVFNIGGGTANTTSLLELLELIGELSGHPPDVRFDEWRPADQQYYVSDTRKFLAATGWAPKIGVREGVTRLYQWLHEFRRAAPVLLPGGRRVEPRNGDVVRLSPATIRFNPARSRKPPKLKRFSQQANGNIKHAGRELAKAV
jgi:CDP-paratose 2-epimerase